MKTILKWVICTILLLTFIVPSNTGTPISNIISIERYLDARKDEILLLTKLINSESGTENYIDKLLVGSVVLNRMRKNDHNMEQVVFKPRMFSGIHTKGFRVTDESKRAATFLIINGPIDTSILYFLNPEISTNRGWVNVVMRRELVFKNTNHYFYK